MKKSELSIEQLEKINFAIQHGLRSNDWELISLLSGGLTGVPVYQLSVENKSYVIKLENTNDKNFDLGRSYKIIEMVSKQGISPLVYFTNVERGIILMDYIESKPRPEASPASMQKFADILRSLHDKNSFSKWKSVIEILEQIYQRLSSEYMQKNIIKKCMQEINKISPILFDQKDIKSCHCDLNPVNILFDGNNYFLVDWQAASPQSFYFDLAYCSTWFYFYNEDLCESFLAYYLKREATVEEKSKYYLMRIFTHIYLGIGFISLPLQANKNFSALSDQGIEQLPTYLQFMQSLAAGKVNLADANAQQQFGFIFLKTVEKMMNDKYQHAYDLLVKSHLSSGDKAIDK